MSSGLSDSLYTRYIKPVLGRCSVGEHIARTLCERFDPVLCLIANSALIAWCERRRFHHGYLDTNSRRFRRRSYIAGVVLETPRNNN